MFKFKEKKNQERRKLLSQSIKKQTRVTDNFATLAQEDKKQPSGFAKEPNIKTSPFNKTLQNEFLYK